MKILTIIGQIILIAFVGLLTREGWRIYNEQIRIDRVARDAVRMQVRVDHVSHERKSWRDYISNSRYVSFPYQGKEHDLRYSQDSVFLQEGILIPVYYSPSSDEFVQKIKGLDERQNGKTSPLVWFTVLSLVSTTHAILAFCCAISLILVIFVLGFLARLTGIAAIWKVQDIFTGFCALALALYFSYNAFAHWRYYSRLSKEGIVQRVKVEDIFRTYDTRNHDNSDVFLFYVYRARVIFSGERRFIAVGRKDYEEVHPGGELPVLYDAGVDDMMGVNYRPLAVDYVFPVVIWGIVLWVMFRRRQESVGS
jgi:hypothetical protein